MRVFTGFILLFLLCFGHLNAQTIYVNVNAADGGDGTSWETAYNDLQDALTAAENGAAIWVAAGVYTSDTTFFVDNDVTIRGGFIGNETSADAANPLVNLTTLSGDRNGDDMPMDSLAGRADNFRVMAIDSNLTLVTIDGFVFTGGVTATTPDGEFIDSYSGAGIRTYSTIHVSNCAFTANFADYGSAVAVYGGADNCIFNGLSVSGNIANRHGAIYGEVIANTMVRNSMFSGNEAQRGAVYGQDVAGLSVVNCQFVSNNASVRAAGVGIVRSEPVLIDSCTFENNTAVRAAAIYLFQDRDANRPMDAEDHVISNCNFTGNTATQRGGAVYELYTNVRQTNNTYTNNSNSTQNGGAYYAANSGQIHIIEDCIFDGNAAPASRGGAYYSTGAVNLEMRNTTFINNSSTNRGAGLYVFGSSDTLRDDININMDRVTFQNNNNAATGGAFYIQSPVNTTRLNITNSAFLGNSTSDGLGGAIGGISGFITTIDNCDFIGNSVTGSGGAIFFNDRLMDAGLDDNPFSLTITNSRFSSNAASMQGGAIDTRGGLDVDVINCEFLGNLISNGADGGAGGALIFNGDSAQVTDIKLVNNTFNGNIAITLAEDVAFYESPTDQGNDPATVMNVTLQNNAFASESGLTNVQVEDGSINFNSLGGNFFIKAVADSIYNDQDVQNPDELTADDIFVNTDYAGDEGDFNPIDDASNPLVDNGTTGPLVPTTDIEGAERVNAPDIGAYEAFSDPVATEEIEASGLDITFFPNPVIDRMNVAVKEAGVETFKVTLIDLNGRRLGYWNVSAATGSIDFTRVPAGAYVLEININGALYSKQVVKQ